MQLSTRGRYAVMAMTDLASRQSDGCECGPVCLAEIAGRQQLSLAYLEQLFGKLRRAGLVASARGPGGGYRLARTPNEIAIADIVAAVDEPIRATRCEEGSGGCMAIPASGSAGATGNETGGEPGGGSGGGRCQTHDLWYELGLQIELFLKGVSLADVVARRIRGRAVSIARQPDLSLAAD
jgi:Rrf2 family transcriptional regulator, iron-sulfur cluster assembly transcription factor